MVVPDSSSHFQPIYNYDVCVAFIHVCILRLVHTHYYNVCRAIWSLRVSRRSIAHRQEFKFLLPIPKKFALPGKCFSLGEVGT
jgi:hypothetical protein